MLKLKPSESVLIVSGSEKALDFIKKQLDPSIYCPVSYAKNGNEARRMLIAGGYSLVIINTPLPDEFGHDLASKAAEDTARGVLLFVPAEYYEEVCSRVEDEGIVALEKPVSTQLFYQSLKLMTAFNRRVAVLKKENIKLQTKMNEIRIINRAKCCLIEYLQMTEPQAHRYIEKQAMDMRQTRLEIAENILKTYDNR